MTGIRKYMFSFLLMIVCLFVLFHESYEFGREKYEDWQAEEEYEKLTDGTTEKNGEDTLIDFNNLQKINPDIVAWISIPDTKINYPVVKGKDNSFYLTHTISGSENRSGAIFMDIGCDFSFGESGKNIILYGHNMRSKSMFGSLKELYDPGYSDGADIESHPYTVIDTPEFRYIYGVFSSRIVKISEGTEIYTLKFSDEYQWETYMNKAKRQALLYLYRQELKKKNALLTLSTCSSQGENYRLIVQGILVKKEKR